VQIHAAHGYLISEFLSPRANLRDDDWGGSLENRARLLMRVVEAVRAQVGSGFSISVKLNSSDFQKGGFAPGDSKTVAHWLEQKGVDLLEISGGSYEQPAMMDMDGLEERYEEEKRESTKRREAYFLEYAEDMRAAVRTPLMVTGGFRSRAGMEDALASGACDVVGVARPLCVQPSLPARLLDGEIEKMPPYEKALRIGPGVLGPGSSINLVRALNGFATMAFFYQNIFRLADGREGKEKMALLPAFIRHQRHEMNAARTLEPR
jgi:2,4-dienoyl-CoA reductase-like NADH-dependent reductase (Old Yellow Enzyme family)